MTSYPETHYARSGSVNIAYQVLGDGPFDLVYAPPFVSNMELYWESPAAEFFRRIASFCRLILFDKRGTGLSDRVPVGTLDERIDDIRAVMDGSGSGCAALVGVSDGGPMSILFTATYPERVRALVLIGTFAHNNRTREVHDKQREWYATNWGTGEGSKYLYSSLPEDEARAAAARHERLTASPGSVLALHDMNWRLDVRPFLASISVPTLVLHQTDDLRIPVAAGRYIAHKIPGAILRELPGNEHFPELGDWEAVVAELEEFLTGVRPAPFPSRAVATVLFTDIVDSSVHAARLGDERWRTLLDTHDDIGRRTVDQFRGRWVKSTGDGILATFDGPARAVSCADALRRAEARIGLQIRAGVHAGEYAIRGDDLSGIAVHTAQRVSAAAEPGEVLVSSTVTSLVGGSGLEFDDRGERQLKGIPGEWRLYALK